MHELKPKFNEHALLEDPQMLDAVTRLNAQTRELAPVLNGTELPSAARVESSNPEVPVNCTVRRLRSDTFLFATVMRDGTTTARFRMDGLPAKASAEVIGEGRSILVRGGAFKDSFGPWNVHLCRIHR